MTAMSIRYPASRQGQLPLDSETADDTWNAQDLETFANRHTEDVVIYLPAAPTQYGIQAHRDF